MNKIKKISVNIMATTGASIVLLYFFMIISGCGFIFISFIFQVFGANIVVHLGLFFIRKFANKHFFLRILVDIAYINAVLAGFGIFFGWYGAADRLAGVPVWIPAVMSIAIYILGLLIEISEIREGAEETNKLLQESK